MRPPKTLDDYLNLEYSMSVIADPNGGYVAAFPDLPGCFAQAEELGSLMSLADEARVAWISGEHADGHDIPLPSHPEAYSGKFNVRLPRSLHRRLAESAEREGVSLNQHVVSLLSEGNALTRVDRRLDMLEGRLTEHASQIREEMRHVLDDVRYQVSGEPRASSNNPRLHLVPTDVAVKEALAV